MDTDRPGRRSRGVIRGLPAELTSFVDRRGDIAEVKRRLEANRLVTLTGVGGVGKTRLAVEVVSQVHRAFADGVCFAGLGTLTDGALVGYEVVASLGLDDTRESGPLELLANYLADRQLLLLLDNCEHLLDACAEIAVRLLRGCPNVRILCTSRQPLGVLGETLFPVAPLPTGGPGEPDDDAEPSAVALFAARAAAAAPGFTISARNAQPVLDVCTRLDGLPLAIELAAAQMRTRTVEQLVAGLDDRFRLLGLRHATPAHHRRLRDAFDWSFELCQPAEQLLWARLSVFRGGFDYDAATAVCMSAELPVDDLIDPLAGLVDKSILLREDLRGQARYRLLETVREYGASRAVTMGEDVAALRERHARWYLCLAERFDAEWFGPDQLWWARQLRFEQDNLRAALGWCLATPGQASTGQRLATALRYFWFACGVLGEGRYWLESALAADPSPTRARAAAQSAYTRVLITQGRMTAAAASSDAVLALAPVREDPVLTASALYEAGAAVLLGDGDLDHAQELLDKAEAAFANGTDPLSRTMALTTSALTALYRGDLDRADHLSIQCQQICRDRGDLWWLANTLQVSAAVAFARSELDRGGRYAREALELHHRLGDSRGLSVVFDGLATAAADDDPVQAAALLGIGFRLWLSIGGDRSKPDMYWHGREDLRTAVRSRLGERDFDAAFGRGRAMSQEAAIGYALGASPTREHAPGGQHPAEVPLTRRQQDVARLLGKGLSNRQIAARLVISPRTAESHVENILRKLGFTSRVQLAAWINEGHIEPG